MSPLMRGTGPILLALLLQAGCSSPAALPVPPVVTDTLQNKFSVSCSTSMCVLHPLDNKKTPAPLSCETGSDGSDQFVLVWDRVIRIHALRVSSSGVAHYSLAEPGHPILCTSNSDCQFPTGNTFTCVSQICQQTETAMTTGDVVALCQAGIPWPSTCPYISDPVFAAKVAEVSAGCGAKALCDKVPADCWNPAFSPTMDGGPALDADVFLEPESPLDAGSALEASDSNPADSNPDDGGALDAGDSLDGGVLDMATSPDVPSRVDASHDLSDTSLTAAADLCDAGSGLDVGRGLDAWDGLDGPAGIDSGSCVDGT